MLMKEVMKSLAIKPSDVVVDATIGGAGHFSSLLAALNSEGTIIGIDADSAAAERGRRAYALDRRSERPVAHIVNDNFRNLARIIDRLGIAQVNAILFDLGWSGYQISARHGFSFQNEEPLLMNYSEGGETAADIVNSSPEHVLADLIYKYGEERFAHNIARAIVRSRSKNRILTTKTLVSAILAGTPKWYQHGRIHPATKTFQALRIAVNDEIGAINDGLRAAIAALAPGGRLAVIAFHSIEDRTVKNILRDAVQTGMGTLMTKKPIIPTRSEILRNRRARSAKMRVFEKSTVLFDEMKSFSSTFSYA